MNEALQLMGTTPIEAINRAEVDMQITTAKKYPRDTTVALASSIAMVTRSKKSALKCIYCRPVGRNKFSGKMDFATGVSIRAMEALYYNWKNLRIGSLLIGEQEGKMIVRGTCFDLENNVMVTKEASKSVSTYSENQKAVTAQALASIAIRNATEGSIPEFFRDELLDAAKEKVAGSTPEELKENYKKLLVGFIKMGATEKQVKELGEIETLDDLDSENLSFLVGVRNFLSDHEENIPDVFDLKKKKAKDQAAAGSKKPEEKKKEEAPDQEKEEAPKDQPNAAQRFNTLHLQYTTLFGDDKTDELLKKYQEKFNKVNIAKFTDKQYDEVSSAMADAVSA